MKLPVAIVLGTARAKRESEKIAQLPLTILNADGRTEPVLVDVRDHLASSHTVLPWDVQGTEHVVTPWKELALQARGFVFVVPEYNYGYPGELKLLLDTLYREYRNKPVMLCGVSSGRFGGARVVEHLKPVLIELGLIPVNPALHVIEVGSFFTDFRETDRVTFKKHAGNAITELLSFTSSSVS